MRIAVMVNSLVNTTDGIARHAIRLSREFAALGHQVTIFAVEYDKSSCSKMVQNLPVESLRSPRLFDLPPVTITGLRMLTWLQSLQSTYFEQVKLSHMMSNEYDVVNPHGNLIIWSATEYKRRFGIPVVWMCNDYWPMAYHDPAISSSRLQKLKLLIKNLISLPIKTYDKKSVSEINEIVVLSELVRKQIASYYGASPTIIRLGVDVDKFSKGDGSWVKPYHSIRGSSFLLLTVCSLIFRRRLEDVIQAIGILVSQGYDIKYIIVGRTTSEPEYTQFIRAQIAEHNLENHVLLIGEVSEEELVDYYDVCDAFIWPADENQSWGMAATEAMSSGKPIIVSRANGLAEIIEDKITGFLVSPRIPIAIADALKKLISNPSLAKSVGEAGQQLMRKEYSWRSHANQMVGLFQRVMGKPSISI